MIDGVATKKLRVLVKTSPLKMSVSVTNMFQPPIKLKPMSLEKILQKHPNCTSNHATYKF